MLPDSQHAPTGVEQRPIGGLVSGSVSAKLRQPPFTVLCRRRNVGVMDWTPMPEAAVNQHDESLPRKRDFNLNAPASYGAIMLPESVSSLVKRRSYAQLRPTIAAPVRPHRLPNPLTGGLRMNDSSNPAIGGQRT